jgi:aromatic ring-opening dioxygenase catalytic subunit (LigB family)
MWRTTIRRTTKEDEHDEPNACHFFRARQSDERVTEYAWTKAWALIGNGIPKPKSIVCVSAHWYLPATLVTAQE